MSRYLKRALWLAAFFLLCFGAGVVLQQPQAGSEPSSADLGANAEPLEDCPVSVMAQELGVKGPGVDVEEAADPALFEGAEAAEDKKQSSALPQAQAEDPGVNDTSGAHQSAVVASVAAEQPVVVAQDQAVRMVQDAEDDDVPTANEARKTVNFASVTSGAVVLEHSPTSKNFGNLLVDDMDKYGMSPCNDKKWVVFSLSEDIRIHTVLLANYEKYSSPVKEFQILGSTSYPVSEWMDLGTYTAENKLGEQKFELGTRAWVRYLKIRFLTHYSREFFCTLSQIKVHGSTMMENLKQEWQQNDEKLRKMQTAMESPDDADDDEELPESTSGGEEEPKPSDAPAVPAEPTPQASSTPTGSEQPTTGAGNAATAVGAPQEQPQSQPQEEGAQETKQESAATGPSSQQQEPVQKQSAAPEAAPTGVDVDPNTSNAGVPVSLEPTTAKDGQSSTGAEPEKPDQTASPTDKPLVVDKKEAVSDGSAKPDKITAEATATGSTATATTSAPIDANTARQQIPAPKPEKAPTPVTGAIPSTVTASTTSTATAGGATRPDDSTNSTNSAKPANQEPDMKAASGKNRTHQSEGSDLHWQQKVESPLASMLFTAGSRRILQNATACIQMLKFQEYKEKMLAKMPEFTMTNKEKTPSANASPTENIFQGLLQKVHGMELNQAVVEKYLASVHECYGLLLQDAHRAIGELQEQVSLQSASSTNFHHLDVQDISALLSVPLQMAKREWEVLSRTIVTDSRDFEYRLLFAAMWLMSSLSLMLSLSMCFCFRTQRRPQESQHKKVDA